MVFVSINTLENIYYEIIKTPYHRYRIYRYY